MIQVVRAIFIVVLIGTVNHDSFCQSIPRSEYISKKLSVETKFGNIEFEIHGNNSRIHYINRVLEVLKKDSKPILEYFHYKPSSPIHFILDPAPALANGSARVFPYPMVRLNLFPPFGNGHLLTGEDWIKVLVLHELVHITHLDQTRGFMYGIRAIFGNVSTALTSITPRWFAEGVAVWAETEFTKGGRLSQDLALFETHRKILDPSFCSTIDCLDSPGDYPYASLSYWLGSLFLDHVEKKSPGLISCIVQKNSRKLPFFMATAYYDCSGDKQISSDFKEFIKTKRAELEKNRLALLSNSLLRELTPIDLTKWGEPIFQKDFRVYKGKLLFVSDVLESPTPFELDLRTKKAESKKWRLHIENIAPIPHLRKDMDWVLSSSKRNRSYGVRQPVLISNNIEKRKDFSKGGDYPLVGKTNLYFFRYIKDTWVLFKSHNGKEKEIHRFPKLLEVTFPRISLIGDKEFISFVTYLNNSERPYQYWIIETSLGANAQVLRESRDPLQFLEQCENKFFFREKEDMLVVAEATALDQVRVRELKLSWIKQITKVRWDDEDTVLLLKDDPTHIYHLNKGCKESSKLLLEEVLKDKVETLKSVSKDLIKNSTPQTDFVSYPKGAHFLPHWWFIKWASNDETSLIGVMTSINDPREVHTASLSLDVYTDQKEYAPGLDYTYALIEKKDYLDSNFLAYLRLGYNKSFTKNSIRNNLDKQETAQSSITGVWRSNVLTYTSSLSVSQQSQVDFIGKRKFLNYGLHQNFLRGSLFAKDFIQKLSLGHRYGLQQTKEAKDFWSHKLYIKTTFQPFRRLYFHMNGAYGKNKKAGLSDGVIYAGGSSNSSLFPFYGIRSTDSFGNEVTSYRLQLDWEILRVYRSLYTFPLFLRKFNIIGGTDYLKSDYIYTQKDKSFLIGEHLTGYHIGLRTALTAFYWVPIDFDFIVNKTKNDFGSDKTELVSAFNTSLSF